jgi:hypothetical protein
MAEPAGLSIMRPMCTKMANSNESLLRETNQDSYTNVL